jgi:transcriptional regulator with XRE-family HTH domain
MARKIGKYTAVGLRIAALGVRQADLAKVLGLRADLAKVLGLSQQSVSKKMRGEVPVFVSDIQKLAKKYKRPMCYFFMGKDGCEAARCGGILHLVE